MDASKGDEKVILGSAYGLIRQVVMRARVCARGGYVSHIHMRHLWPLPRRSENFAGSVKGLRYGIETRIQ